jgi:hypothetical protein
MDKENMLYIHKMEFYLAMEKNEIMLFAGKWVELEIIMVSEISLLSTICRI